MAADKSSQFWILITVLLIASIIIGGIIAWVKYSPSHPIEISLPASQEIQTEIYLGGAVASPGFYPLKLGDSIETLIQAAGGITDDADLTQLQLYFPQLGEETPPQKIDLNRAEAWLLEALPGIGESKAQAIIAYRQQHGGFDNITELIEVEGIGPAIYEQIKDLVTVAD